MRHRLGAALLLGSISGFTGQVQGQIVTIDEGTFDVTVAGRPVGTETFSIVRTGDGADAQTLARAQVRIDMEDGSRQLAPLLRTEGLAHILSRYQLKTAGIDEREVYVERSGARRLHATVVTSEGQREQEFRFQPDAVVLEDGVTHHFHFLAARIASGSRTVPVLIPAGRDQLTAEISEGTREGVEIAGTSVSAMRYQVRYGTATRLVWLDDQQRVLRVEDPDSRRVAVRREVP